MLSQILGTDKPLKPAPIGIYFSCPQFLHLTTTLEALIEVLLA
jgi:hypothetical protein